MAIERIPCRSGKPDDNKYSKTWTDSVWIIESSTVFWTIKLVQFPWNDLPRIIFQNSYWYFWIISNQRYHDFLNSVELIFTGFNPPSSDESISGFRLMSCISFTAAVYDDVSSGRFAFARPTSAAITRATVNILHSRIKSHKKFVPQNVGLVSLTNIRILAFRRLCRNRDSRSKLNDDDNNNN